MTTLALRGGEIVTPLEERFTTLWLRGSVIGGLGDRNPDGTSGHTTLDVSGCYVTPGLFDLQVNGSAKCNLWADPQPSELAALRADLAKQGVTSFLPTLITDEIGHLKKNLAFLAEHGAGSEQLDAGRQIKGARMPGVHLEGPCLSPERPGVHPRQWLQPLTKTLMEELATSYVALVTLAPELEGDGSSVEFLVGRGIRVSLGHSNATYQEAELAFDRGVRLMTHAFNALPPLHHRQPGAVAAAFRNCLVSACVICDGLHVDPNMVRILIRYKGVPQVILVSDAAHVGTSQGGLVGSSITLAEAVRNVVGWGIVGFADAVRMASWNPASVMGYQDKIGHLAPGKCADVVVWDRQTLEVKHVILAGKLLF
ncbi:MAG TPA: amidohydrolase family protein [Candidatus Obscuribacterales bacterium]